MNTVCIFSNDICMEFSINKCGILWWKGELSRSEGVKIPSGEVIREFDTNLGYR